MSEINSSPSDNRKRQRQRHGGRYIKSDLLLILLNGAGKLMDSDNNREGDFYGK